MNSSQAPQNDAETKIIILCENCSQKLRIPRRNKKLRVICPICRHEFDFRYYALGFSSNSKKPLLVGLLGSLIGFSIVEIIEQTKVSVPTSAVSLLLSTMLVTGAFGICLGASMGAADGFLRKNQGRLFYGLVVGLFWD